MQRNSFANAFTQQTIFMAEIINGWHVNIMEQICKKTKLFKNNNLLFKQTSVYIKVDAIL
jgi:hypothetical protein